MPAVKVISKELSENPSADKTNDFKPIIKDLVPAFTNIAAQIAAAHGEDLDEFKKISVQLYERPKKQSKFLELKNALLSEPLAEKYKADANSTMALCSDFKTETKEELAIICEAQDLVSNPKLLKYFGELAQGAEKSSEGLVEAVKKANTNLVEEELNVEGKECIEQTADRVAKLQSGMNMGIIGELLSTLGQFANVNDKSTTAGKINGMIQEKNATAVPELLNQFTRQTLKQSQLLDWVIQEADPAKQDTLDLTALTAKAKSQLKSVEQSIKKLSTSPDSASTKEIEQFSETIKSIQSKLVNSDTLCQKNIFFNGAIQSLNLANLDPDSIANALIAAEQLYQSIKAEMDNATDPEYKSALGNELKRCEQCDFFIN